MESAGTPTFYFDLNSPFSYLAAFRVDRVLPVEAVWQPVWIIPIVGASGREWRQTTEVAAGRQADVEQRAAAYGMPPWRWPDRYQEARERGLDAEPVNTLQTMRLATFAHQAAVGKEFAMRAYHLIFGEGHDPTLVDDDLIGVAQACGLDPDEARAAIGDQQIKDALKEATEAAVGRGVIGLPTVAVGDELFWGDDRLDEAAASMRAPA